MAVTESNDNSTETQTIGDFFNDLRHGTYVSSYGNVHIYVGTTWNDDTRSYVPRVLNPRDFAVTKVSALDHSNAAFGSNIWEIIDDGDGNPMVADSYMRRIAREFCDRSLRLTTQLTKVISLESQILDLQDDWHTLNTFLNEYADEQQMCSDYERRLDTWNKDLHKLQLEGRYRDWTVGVVCQELWDGTAYITVRASSPAQADRIAESLSTEELIKKVVEADSVSIKSVGTVSVTVNAY